MLPSPTRVEINVGIAVIGVEFCFVSRQAKNTGSTPLFIVAQNGNAGIVETLLQHGASVDQARARSPAPPSHYSRPG